MKLLGVSHTVHGSASTILTKEGLIAAVQEERFDRIKYSSTFPSRATAYCLDYAKTSLKGLDGLAYFMSSCNFLKSINRAHSEKLRFHPEAYYSFPNFILPKLSNNWYEMVEQKFFSYNAGKSINFYYVDHHLSHAAGAYYLSPFKKAAVLTVDGWGDGVTTMLSRAESGKIKPFLRVLFPNSLGGFYSTFTEYLGFVPNSDEYKVMGMAAYGKPDRYYDNVKRLIRLKKDGSYELDLSYFSFYMPEAKRFTQKFIERFGPARSEHESVTQRHMDIAAACQKVLEETLFYIIKKLHKATSCDSLCYAGGVALNCLANGKILQNTEFKNLFIPPDPTDSGASAGCASYAYYSLNNKEKHRALVSDYLGPEYTNNYIQHILDNNGISYWKPKDIVSEAARLISKGRVIGWFQGRMEFGPRALGNRSILADPRKAYMKNLVNSKIKFREEFRPFAPSVIEERAGNYFQIPKGLLWNSSPLDYMLCVVPVLKKARSLIPAVTHQDQTARIQIVRRDANEKYWRLIYEFEKITGIAILLNTSFNVRSEPIVLSPQDALRCFSTSGLDDLAMGDFLISKKR